jgi:hypothetical protein
MRQIIGKVKLAANQEKTRLPQVHETFADVTARPAQFIEEVNNARRMHPLGYVSADHVELQLAEPVPSIFYGPQASFKATPTLGRFRKSQQWNASRGLRLHTARDKKARSISLHMTGASTLVH